MGKFTMMDYQPGYFHYKKQVRSGSPANTCPNCELSLMDDLLSRSRDQDHVTAGHLSPQGITETEQNICLLRTWRASSSQQRKNVIRTHGKNVLRVMDEVSFTDNRHAAIQRIMQSVIAEY